MCRDFLFMSVLRIRQLAVLELASSHPIHHFFFFEYLGEVVPSLIIFLVVELVLFEIQHFHGERLAIPILEHKLLAEAH